MDGDQMQVRRIQGCDQDYGKSYGELKTFSFPHGLELHSIRLLNKCNEMQVGSIECYGVGLLLRSFSSKLCLSSHRIVEWMALDGTLSLKGLTSVGY
jgi:hypothetical protein